MGCQYNSHHTNSTTSMCVITMYVYSVHGKHIWSKNTDIHIGGTSIHSLRYADDAVISAESEQDLQEIA